jgi:hypothetical protein
LPVTIKLSSDNGRWLSASVNSMREQPLKWNPLSSELLPWRTTKQ